MIARWTSVDPLVEAGQESTSPYGYVFDDPIKNTDPDGRAPECCGAFLNAVGNRIVSNFKNMGTAIAHPINTATTILTSKEAWTTSVLDASTFGSYSAGKELYGAYKSVEAATDGNYTPLANLTGDAATTVIIGAATEGAGRGLNAVGGYIESQVGLAIKDATWAGPVDYSGLPEPANVQSGANFTPAQLKAAKAANAEANYGEMRSDIDGQRMNPSKQSQRGVKADMSQVEGDHKNPKKPKNKTQTPGTNSNQNLQLTTKRQNIQKRNN